MKYEIMNTVASLVDQKAQDAANAKVATAAEKVKSAAAILATATASHRAASNAAELAVGAGSAEAFEKGELHEAEKRRLDVATRVHASATAAHQAAVDALPVAKGISYQPVYCYGVELSIAAGRKADAARAMLAEAEEDDKAAVEVLRHAVNDCGCRDATFGRFLQPVPLTFNDRFNLFNVGIHTAWFNGTDVEGKVKS